MSRVAPMRNVLKALALLVGLCGVLGLVGYGLSGVRVGSVFVFCGLLVAAAGYWYADRAAMGMVGARELPQAEAPGLHSTVERLAARAGVLKPRIYLLERGPLLALSAGRGRMSSVLAVTPGLVALQSPAEVEAVIAHELAHVRNRDVLVQTSVVVLAAALVEASRIGGWLQRALLIVLGPVAAAFAHLVSSPKREFDADRPAAEI